MEARSILRRDDPSDPRLKLMCDRIILLLRSSSSVSVWFDWLWLLSRLLHTLPTGDVGILILLFGLYRIFLLELLNKLLPLKLLNTLLPLLRALPPSTLLLPLLRELRERLLRKLWLGERLLLRKLLLRMLLLRERLLRKLLLRRLLLLRLLLRKLLLRKLLLSKLLLSLPRGILKLPLLLFSALECSEVDFSGI